MYPDPESGKRFRRQQRRGYLYVAVLFTSLIVGATIATVIAIDTTRLKRNNSENDRHGALRAAESEVHRVAVQLAGQPEWRTEHKEGGLSNWLDYGWQFGDSTASTRYQLNDEDGDLADDVYDEVEIVAHAKYGNSQAAVAVELEPELAPLDILRYGVTTESDLRLEFASAVASERPVQVGDFCWTYTRGLITTPMLTCEDGVYVNVRGDAEVGSVEMPDYNVVDRYVNVGTEIDINALTGTVGARTINRAVLTKSENPYGNVDPAGVYWIDAQSSSIVISHSRIDATLAIRNAGTVTITGAVSWEFPTTPDAILVTDGDVQFTAIEPTLNEQTVLTNFNPASSPYRGTYSNETLLDKFPTLFRGIVYSAGEVQVLATADNSALEITGPLIANQLSAFHSVHLHALDGLLESKPIGFVDHSRLQIRSGTYRRVPIPQ